MKTSDLITAITQDHRVSPPPARALALAVTGGAVIAALVFFFVAGPRADLADVALTPRFAFKVLLQIALLVAAVGSVLRLSRPSGRLGHWNQVLLGVSCVLLVGVIAELFV
ncbi:MAG: NrsF family protein, partial [Pseudomonadota bacterium]